MQIVEACRTRVFIFFLERYSTHQLPPSIPHRTLTPSSAEISRLENFSSRESVVVCLYVSSGPSLGTMDSGGSVMVLRMDRMRTFSDRASYKRPRAAGSPRPDWDRACRSSGWAEAILSARRYGI